MDFRLASRVFGYTTLRGENGLQTTRACACMFRHRDRDIDLMANDDDFTTTGDHDDSKWLQKLFEERFDISTHITGHGIEDDSVGVPFWPGMLFFC